jgi:uncharacterized protein YcfJ
MKRLVLIALIPALVGCANLTKQQQSLAGGAIGAVAGYQLTGADKDKVWAMVLGTLAGAMIGNVFEATTESGDWWKFWD